jgi:tetratricopeptide (TPR) repeat protein
MTTTLSDEQLKKKLLKATEYARERDLENAVLQLKQILQSHPRHEVSMGMLASIYLQIGMHQKAIEQFEALLTAHPKNPLARFQLGMASLANEEPEKALSQWAPMLEMENEFMAHFHSALALIQLNRLDEALPLIEHARSNMPEAHPLYTKLLEIRTRLNSHLNVN